MDRNVELLSSFLDWARSEGIEMTIEQRVQEIRDVAPPSSPEPDYQEVILVEKIDLHEVFTNKELAERFLDSQ